VGQPGAGCRDGVWAVTRAWLTESQYAAPHDDVHDGEAARTGVAVHPRGAAVTTVVVPRQGIAGTLRLVPYPYDTHTDRVEAGNHVDQACTREPDS
jgi:hypothetical protein